MVRLGKKKDPSAFQRPIAILHSVTSACLSNHTCHQSLCSGQMVSIQSFVLNRFLRPQGLCTHDFLCLERPLLFHLVIFLFLLQEVSLKHPSSRKLTMYLPCCIHAWPTCLPNGDGSTCLCNRVCFLPHSPLGNWVGGFLLMPYLPYSSCLEDHRFPPTKHTWRVE